MIPDWTLGDVLLAGVAGLGLVSTLAFVIAYARRSGFAWSRNAAGRYLMIHHALLASLFCIIEANRWFPGWFGREYVTAVVLLGFVLHSFAAYQLVRTAYEPKQEEATRNDRRQ